MIIIILNEDINNIVISVGKNDKKFGIYKIKSFIKLITPIILLIILSIMLQINDA